MLTSFHGRGSTQAVPRQSSSRTTFDATAKEKFLSDTAMLGSDDCAELSPGMPLDQAAMDMAQRASCSAVSGQAGAPGGLLEINADVARAGRVADVAAMLEHRQAEVLQWMDTDMWTLLHFTCRSPPSRATAELLIRAGADVDRTTDENRTPLFLCASNGTDEHVAIAECLLGRGADTSTKDVLGATALDVARKKGNATMSNLLEKHGGTTGQDELAQVHAPRASSAWSASSANSATHSGGRISKKLSESEVDKFQLDTARATINMANKIGSGSFADVYAGQYDFCKKGNTCVAYKAFRDMCTVDQVCASVDMARELEIGYRIRHKNLVKIYGIVAVGLTVCLVMERMRDQSLGDLLGDTTTRVSWALRFKFAHDVARGMLHLHELEPMPIVHRDLKSSNVLLSVADDLEHCTAKVSDFGLSKELASTANTYGGVGTLAWSAPETFNGEFGEKSDVFSFGVVLYELGSRAQPFQGASRQKILKLITTIFEYDPSDFEELGLDEAKQLARWQRKNPLAHRRPNLALLEADCPISVRQAMQQCWGDAPGPRPDFAALEALFKAGLPKRNEHVEALEAKMAKLNLDDTRLKIMAAVSSKDHGTVEALLGAAMSMPHDTSQFVPLAERPGGLMLQFCCELFQADCFDTDLWVVIEAAARLYFDAQVTNVPNEMATIEASIAQITTGSGHEGMYAAEMDRLTDGLDSNGVPNDKDFAKYIKQFDDLSKSLPEAPLQQQTSDVCTVYQHGRVAAPMFQDFMEELAKGTKSVFKMAPPKKIYRMGEKIGVRAKKPWDGSTVVDAVRGTVEIPEGGMGRGMRFLNLLQGADPRLGGAFQNASHTKICIVGIKNRWPPNKPAQGGWRCGQVYFSFLADPNSHVCELQIVHEAMESVRKEIGNAGYQWFGSNRSSSQLKAAWGARQSAGLSSPANGTMAMSQASDVKPDSCAYL